MRFSSNERIPPTVAILLPLPTLPKLTLLTLPRTRISGRRVRPSRQAEHVLITRLDTHPVRISCVAPGTGMMRRKRVGKPGCVVRHAPLASMRFGLPSVLLSPVPFPPHRGESNASPMDGRPLGAFLERFSADVTANAGFSYRSSDTFDSHARHSMFHSVVWIFGHRAGRTFYPRI